MLPPAKVVVPPLKVVFEFTVKTVPLSTEKSPFSMAPLKVEPFGMIVWAAAGAARAIHAIAGARTQARLEFRRRTETGLARFITYPNIQKQAH